MLSVLSSLAVSVADKTPSLAVSVLALSVSGVATLIAFIMYLIERTRMKVTPSILPQRIIRKDEPNARYALVRDRGAIHAVGEGTIEGAFLDVLHGTLVGDTGEFPRSFFFGDQTVNYRFIASRTAISEGLEPIVAMYWWRSSIIGRKLVGVRFHAISLRYEKLTRSALRPWNRTWKRAGKDPIAIRTYTGEPSSRFGLW